MIAMMTPIPVVNVDLCAHVFDVNRVEDRIDFILPIGTIQIGAN